MKLSWFKMNHIIIHLILNKTDQFLLIIGVQKNINLKYLNNSRIKKQQEKRTKILKYQLKKIKLYYINWQMKFSKSNKKEIYLIQKKFFSSEVFYFMKRKEINHCNNQLIQLKNLCRIMIKIKSQIYLLKMENLS